MTTKKHSTGEEPDTGSFREGFLKAHDADQRLNLIEKEINNGLEDKQIAAELTRAHNEGHVDVVELFCSLNNTSPDFFRIRHTFEIVLPELEADTTDVMRCVQHLVEQAGEDMAAGHTINAFVTYMERYPARVREALKACENEDGLTALLPAVLICGSGEEPDEYEQETLRLIEASDYESRKQAMFALGQLGKGEMPTVSEEIYAALERAVTDEEDDELLRTIAKTAAALIRQDRGQLDRLLGILDTAIAKGDEATTHSAAEIFAELNDEAPEALLTTIEPHLSRIRPKNSGTIRLLDQGLHRMVRRGRGPEAIALIERIAAAADRKLRISDLDTTIRALHADANLRSIAVTRWLLTGDVNLCRAAEHVVGLGHAANPDLQIDATSVNPSSPAEVLYLARKIVGYLFATPESTVAALVSLMRQVQDESLATHIGQLLLDPILINFPGKARRRVEALGATETGPAKRVIDMVLEKLEEYLDGLRSIDAFPELRPSEAQREAYRRYQTRQMAESMKEAQRRSVLASIFKTQTILYGRSSINCVFRRR